MAPGPPAVRVLARPGGPIPVARSRVVGPAAPARPATAARWIRVIAPGIRLAVPERLLATAAPAEQPAPTAAALAGPVGKLLQYAVQAVEVGHQAAAALRRLAAARRLAGIAAVRAWPVRTWPVRTVPVGTPPPGTAPPAVAAFFWFGLDGAGDDPAPAGAPLAIRICGLSGRTGRASCELAPRRLCRRGTPPGAVPAGRPRRRAPAPGIPASRPRCHRPAPGRIAARIAGRQGVTPGSIPSGRSRWNSPTPSIPAGRPGRYDPTAGRIPAGWCGRGRTAPGSIPASRLGRPGTAGRSGRGGRRGSAPCRIPASGPGCGLAAPRIRGAWLARNPHRPGRTTAAWTRRATGSQVSARVPSPGSAAGARPCRAARAHVRPRVPHSGPAASVRAGRPARGRIPLTGYPAATWPRGPARVWVPPVPATGPRRPAPEVSRRLGASTAVLAFGI